MAVLYRTETYSGSLERRFAHVLRFELFELGNTHILYELIQNGLVRTQELVAQMKSMVEEWEENGYMDDMPETDQLEFLEKVRLEISAQTGRNIQYARKRQISWCLAQGYGMRENTIESNKVPCTHE